MAGGPYLPKPHRMDPMRESGFRMRWDAHMASRYVVVEVRCSTDPQPENEPLHTYKRHQSEQQAWDAVVDHLEYQRRMGVLQAGRWCITMPGSNRKHSFEVE